MSALPYLPVVVMEMEGAGGDRLDVLLGPPKDNLRKFRVRNDHLRLIIPHCRHHEIWNFCSFCLLFCLWLLEYCLECSGAR